MMLNKLCYIYIFFFRGYYTYMASFSLSMCQLRVLFLCSGVSCKITLNVYVLCCLWVGCRCNVETDCSTFHCNK